MARHFIHLTDCSTEELVSLLDAADRLRGAWTAGRVPQVLENRNIALVWDASGFRNRVSFELGIVAMGGRAVQVPGRLDVRESIEDVVRYLQNWFHAIVARTETHAHIVRLAAGSSIPVINARTDHNHPCEILGDLAWIRAQRGTLDGLKVVFVGEATNLCHTWFEAAARLPIEVIQVCPKGYEVDEAFMRDLSRGARGGLGVCNDLERSLRGVDVVYTDCWPRREGAEEQARIREEFLPYQVTSHILAVAKPSCCFLPCPPVTRGEEVSAEVMESYGAAVYRAKEYLLHAQNAVLSLLVGEARG